MRRKELWQVCGRRDIAQIWQNILYQREREHKWMRKSRIENTWRRGREEENGKGEGRKEKKNKKKRKEKRRRVPHAWFYPATHKDPWVHTIAAKIFLRWRLDMESEKALPQSSRPKDIKITGSLTKSKPVSCHWRL